MDELPSAEFRKTYAKLTEATVVTVNGHRIGTWIPNDIKSVGLHNVELVPANRRDDVAKKFPAGGIQARQAQRDALLSKINRSK